MCLISPKIDEEHASDGRDAMTDAAQQCEHRRSGEAMHNVRDNDCIVTIRDWVLEKISLDNPKAAGDWSFVQTISS